jgi:hypothetical protein
MKVPNAQDPDLTLTPTQSPKQTPAMRSPMPKWVISKELLEAISASSTPLPVSGHLSLENGDRKVIDKDQEEELIRSNGASLEEDGKIGLVL